MMYKIISFVCLSLFAFLLSCVSIILPISLIITAILTDNRGLFLLWVILWWLLNAIFFATPLAIFIPTFLVFLADTIYRKSIYTTPFYIAILGGVYALFFLISPLPKTIKFLGGFFLWHFPWAFAPQA